jgi:hypothetical protein
MGTTEGNIFLWHFCEFQSHHTLLVFIGVADVGWRQDSGEGAEKEKEEEKNQKPFSQ